MKIIKVAKVPGTVKEVVLGDNGTVGEALQLYRDETGQSTSGYEIRMNDTVVSEGSPVADGAKIYLVEQVKGN